MIVHQTSNAETFARPLCGAVGWMGADVDCPKCLRAMLATERTRRESAERETSDLRDRIEKEWSIANDGIRFACAQRDAALWAAFVHALRAELVIDWSDVGRELLATSREAVAHWRTQAAAMERARNDAQAAELRALKNVERLANELQDAKEARRRHVAELEAAHRNLQDRYAKRGTELDDAKAELQAARMPDAIERTIRFALVQFGEAESMLDADDALAWIDGLDARKDVP